MLVQNSLKERREVKFAGGPGKCRTTNPAIDAGVIMDKEKTRDSEERRLSAE